MWIDRQSNVTLVSEFEQKARRAVRLHFNSFVLDYALNVA